MKTLGFEWLGNFHIVAAAVDVGTISVDCSNLYSRRGYVIAVFHIQVVFAEKHFELRHKMWVAGTLTEQDAVRTTVGSLEGLHVPVEGCRECSRFGSAAGTAGETLRGYTVNHVVYTAARN